MARHKDKENRQKQTAPYDKIPGGGLHSEHEAEASGIPQNKPADYKGRPDDNEAVQGDHIHQLETTSETEMDRETTKGARRTARTAHEMSRHDALSRVPGRNKQQGKEKAKE